MIAWLKCVLWRGHAWKFVRNLQGQEYLFQGSKRSEWHCFKCDSFKLKRELHVVEKL